MKLYQDKYDPVVCYADLAPMQDLTEDLRTKAHTYAQDHGCEWIEYYRIHGDGTVTCIDTDKIPK